MSKLSKVIYLILFLLLLLQPHFINHIGAVPKPYVESIVTLFILGTAYLTYELHQQELRKKEKLLSESSKYIGTVNRKLSLLQNLSSDLIASNKLHGKEKKQTFHHLLAIAVVSVAKAKWGILRILDAKRKQILKEFTIFPQNDAPLESQISGQCSIISTSDKKAPFRTFLILPKIDTLNEEHSILQAITDQAQLFYKYLYS